MNHNGNRQIEKRWEKGQMKDMGLGPDKRGRIERGLGFSSFYLLIFFPPPVSFFFFSCFPFLHFFSLVFGGCPYVLSPRRRKEEIRGLLSALPVTLEGAYWNAGRLGRHGRRRLRSILRPDARYVRSSGAPTLTVRLALPPPTPRRATGPSR